MEMEMEMAEGHLHGHCDERFAQLREAIVRRLAGGDELGLSLAVDLDGELLVDLYGGWMDPEQTRPWRRDTIVNVWSTTKTITALAALMLVDRGALELEAPVARYWPEFAANGKERVVVRHLLSHSSGVAGWEQPVTVEDIFDCEAAAARLAAQAPWWEPGTASGYHAASYGALLGELVRRTTASSLRAFVAEEIAGPLRADFQLGAAEADWDRVATVIPPPPLAIDLDALPVPALKTFTGPAIDAAVANTPGWRQADLGAVNGHGNAVSVARILSAVTLGGTAQGVRVLSPETIDLIFEQQASGVDLVVGIPLRRGVGFALPQLETLPYIPDERVCFWGGWGGSMIIIDITRGLTISYMMNRMSAGIIGSEKVRASKPDRRRGGRARRQSDSTHGSDGAIPHLTN